MDQKSVEDYIAILEPPQDWQPNAAAALLRLQGRDRNRKRIWIGGALASTLAGIALLLALPARGSCAQPFLGIVCLEPAASHPSVTPNYKLAGSPRARVTLEIYTDYECPACAQFYATTWPLLVTNYVQTGKIRILHRDFPLPQHKYASLAARYANAAGETGNYDAVVMQLFRTQTMWAATGDVDSQVMKVLPAGAMQQVRQLVNSDTALAATVAADQAAGYSEHLNQTPTLIIVAKGKRERIAPIPSFDLLKRYLDHLQ